jgi:hypothetical protein
LKKEFVPMASNSDWLGGSASEPEAEGYPLKETATVLNDRLGLYLSEEQKRGFATGLLIGTAVAGALLVWSVGGMLRKGLK